MAPNTALAYKPHETNLDNLRLQAVFFTIVASAAAVVLPVLNFVAIWIHHTRWSIEIFVDWGIVVICGLLALLALATRSTGLLLLHVVASMMAGAALGAHNAGIFLDWELRCGLVTPLDPVCGNYGKYHVLVAIQGAVIVAGMAIPALFTLLTLIRLEAENAVDRKKLQWQVLEVLQQKALLQQAQPLSMSIESLSKLLAVLRSSPYNEWRLLAAKTTELLLEQGYDLPALATSPNPTAGLGPPPGGQYFDVPETVPLRGAMVVHDVEKGVPPAAGSRRGAKVVPEPAEDNSPKIAAAPTSPISPNIVINTFTDGSRTSKGSALQPGPAQRPAGSDDGSEEKHRERRKKKKDKKKKRHSSESDSD